VFNQNLNRAFVLLNIDAGLENQLPRLLQEDFEQVLQRPIETTRVTGMWKVVDSHLPVAHLLQFSS
jgi:hypothetical protein